MVLSDSEILKEIKKGTIVIKPFRKECLGGNSYDVHLGKYLRVYKDYELDSKKHNEAISILIPKSGIVIQPNRLYLGVTEEYTETHSFVPWLDGKSSIGRLGIMVHFTAGRGDVGYCNTWTLEIMCTQPIRIYAGMPIGQLTYFDVKGEVMNKYTAKKNPKYTQVTDKPIESMFYKNKF
jgi:dCTP deaminase